MDETKLLQLIAKACDDRKAEDIVILDMQQLSPLTDYYVVCHGNNERQVQSIARAVKATVDEHNITIEQMEGFERGRWILLDVGPVVCHIFHKDERSHYNLERLWGDASIIPFEDIS